MRSKFQIDVTVVTNEFIDHYMAEANGEYVKVYLYMLRHQQESVSMEMIAEALNHTEADVHRALAYWKRLGVLVADQEESAAALTEERTLRDEKRPEEPKTVQTMLPAEVSQAPVADKKIPKARSVYTPEQISSLAQEEDFTQLLYIAQKYMNKVFTPRECEVFAYLYDGLHMSAELLEYLVEYCAQGGHSNIRYIETVAINWHEKEIVTVERAKAYTTSYTKDGFAVMKAFGLNDRKPGEAENEMIRRWFKEYGFAKELVIEACNRTLETIHNPSFQYADKILSEWKKAGVKHLNDVKQLDARRESRKTADSGAAKRQPVAPRTTKNQFHNFEQRDTNYDAMVLERLKERLGEQ
ncbi:MAG: DnaD domain protein [Hungatella sp.]